MKIMYVGAPNIFRLINTLQVSFISLTSFLFAEFILENPAVVIMESNEDLSISLPLFR